MFFYKSVNDIIRIRQKSKIHKQKEVDEISKKVVVLVAMIEDDNMKDKNVEEEKKWTRIRRKRKAKRMKRIEIRMIKRKEEMRR